MRIDNLLHNRSQDKTLDYSLLTDKDLDRCLELLYGTEYDYLKPQHQAELDTIAAKIAVPK